MLYLGLGKTLFNSSACLFSARPGGRPDIELVLSERILGKKAIGAWPEAAIRALGDSGKATEIAENRDVHSPSDHEEGLNQKIPFYDYLARQGLDRYSRHFNHEIQFVTHHRCHAMAAVAMSPFEKCVIVVMDGAGSLRKDFPASLASSEAMEGAASPDSHEECSVYLHDRGRLRSVYKRWRIFRQSKRHPEHTWSSGSGIFYEKMAEYIFNSGRAAGKVMGLASFGKAFRIDDRMELLEALDWDLAFKGSTKKAWEESGRFSAYADLAASAQQDFEEGYFGILHRIRKDYPDYDRIILTGGCALNCTANGKLLRESLFEEVYVPPFPGDECIGFGAASHLFHGDAANDWQPLSHGEQHGYYGPRASVPTDAAIDRAFAGCTISKPASITEHAAKVLAEGRVIGWFQGRSESGPRALGNRSILADPRIPGIKDRMNREVKFREAFRPYGASCLHESAQTYFDVPAGFNSPYMSFAILPRPQYRELLKEICHVDGTSRTQTVRRGQNERFHELIRAFGSRTGLPCLLNTSLNIMGKPIVETVEDARKFLEETPVDGIAVGDHYVQRRS
jgi:carbamoyltransferase